MPMAPPQHTHKPAELVTDATIACEATANELFNRSKSSPPLCVTDLDRWSGGPSSHRQVGFVRLQS